MNLHHSCNLWPELNPIVHCMNRRAELRRLISWAEGKSLEGPAKLYQARLVEEENKLMRYQWRTPKLIVWARLIHGISNLVSPTPRYLPRGSASHWRHQSHKRNLL